MKKKLAVILILVSLILSGCNKNNSDETQNAITDKQTDSLDIVSEDTGSNEVVIPIENFDGYEFHIIARGTGKWASQDMFSEGLTGEPINDAVFERNSYTSDTLNINISEEQIADDGQLLNSIKRSIRSGDNAYDLLWVQAGGISNLALEGMLTNLNSSEKLNLGNNWWDERAVKSLSIGDSVFFTTGDISIINKNATYVITFNKSLVEDYHLDNIYELVITNKWNIDKFGEMSSSVSGDIDGNGIYDSSDLYGFMTYDKDNIGFLMAAGGSVSKINGEEILLNYNTEPSIDMLTRLAAIKGAQSTYFFTDDNQANNMFIDGRILFSFRTLINLNSYRDMETNYGIIPMPKLNEAQDEYYSGIHEYGLSMIGVPVTEKNLDRTGLILEHMGKKSKEILTPAFYDKTLKGKYFSDEESGEMLDIIFSTRVYDIGYFCNWGDFIGKLCTLSRSASDNFASTFASLQKPIENSLTKTLEAFGSIDFLSKDIIEKKETPAEPANDVKTDEAKTAENGITYNIGTLNASDGQINDTNLTRLHTLEYLSLSDYSEITINEGYELTWLAYASDESYIGNGNDFKGNWLGSGVSILTKSILEEYPDAVYFRYAIRKTDNSDVTTDDVAMSGVTAVENGITYNIGTLNASDGQINDTNLTRLHTPEYLALADCSEITINEGYELTWLAYGADKAYIGNGNDFKGNWLGSGVSILTKSILEEYPDAVYFRYAIRKTDNSEVTADDIELSGVKKN